MENGDTTGVEVLELRHIVNFRIDDDPLEEAPESAKPEAAFRKAWHHPQDHRACCAIDRYDRVQPRTQQLESICYVPSQPPRE